LCDSSLFNLIKSELYLLVTVMCTRTRCSKI